MKRLVCCALDTRLLKITNTNVLKLLNQQDGLCWLPEQYYFNQQDHLVNQLHLQDQVQPTLLTMFYK